MSAKILVALSITGLAAAAQAANRLPEAGTYENYVVVTDQGAQDCAGAVIPVPYSIQPISADAFTYRGEGGPIYVCERVHGNVFDCNWPEDLVVDLRPFGIDLVLTLREPGTPVTDLILTGSGTLRRNGHPVFWTCEGSHCALFGFMPECMEHMVAYLERVP